MLHFMELKSWGPHEVAQLEAAARMTYHPSICFTLHRSITILLEGKQKNPNLTMVKSRIFNLTNLSLCILR